MLILTNFYHENIILREEHPSNKDIDLRDCFYILSKLSCVFWVSTADSTVF